MSDTVNFTCDFIAGLLFKCENLTAVILILLYKIVSFGISFSRIKSDTIVKMLILITAFNIGGVVDIQHDVR